MNYYLATLASLAFATIVTFVIYAYRWMDAVKDNHLVHLQKATELTAERMLDVKIALAELGAHESDHHAELLRAIARH